jgi:transcriptional regulator of arginine metabolism
MIRLVKEKAIKTQDELKKLLLEHGFDTTQSSLSRDISEVGLIKINGSYSLPPRQMQGASPSITSMESAGSNLVVVKTLVGMAAPVGITLDNNKIPGVVGSIAGDDTVFLAIASGVSHESVKKHLQRIFKH